VALVAGAMRELADAAEALEALAQALALPRFAMEARFFRATSPTGIDGAALEACAAAARVSPVAARRARALLAGEDAARTLDALDRVVLAAARRVGADRLTTLAGRAAGGDDAAWLPGWGIDSARRSVWWPDGRHVDLTVAPQGVRLLDVLADHRGAASKEQLTLMVWGEREYHPLRHDKRLQVAVLRLRRLIEADPRHPARLVTTEDGYALGTSEPIRRIAPPDADIVWQ